MIKYAKINTYLFVCWKRCHLHIEEVGFYWCCEPEYTEKTTNFQQVSHTRYHIVLQQIHFVTGYNQTHNLRDDNSFLSAKPTTMRS